MEGENYYQSQGLGSARAATYAGRDTTVAAANSYAQQEVSCEEQPFLRTILNGLNNLISVIQIETNVLQEINDKIFGGSPISQTEKTNPPKPIMSIKDEIFAQFEQLDSIVNRLDYQVNKIKKVA